jgi:hypothetical protein
MGTDIRVARKNGSSAAADYSKLRVFRDEYQHAGLVQDRGSSSKRH